LYELDRHFVELRACWIVRWPGKPSVIPTSPIDRIRKLHGIAFGENDLHSQIAGLGKTALTIVWSWIVNGAVLIFHDHDCWTRSWGRSFRNTNNGILIVGDPIRL